jgi:hypothetical protein
MRRAAQRACPYHDTRVVTAQALCGRVSHARPALRAAQSSDGTPCPAPRRCSPLGGGALDTHARSHQPSHAHSHTRTYPPCVIQCCPHQAVHSARTARMRTTTIIPSLPPSATRPLHCSASCGADCTAAPPAAPTALQRLLRRLLRRGLAEQPRCGRGARGSAGGVHVVGGRVDAELRRRILVRLPRHLLVMAARCARRACAQQRRRVGRRRCRLHRRHRLRAQHGLVRARCGCVRRGRARRPRGGGRLGGGGGRVRTLAPLPRRARDEGVELGLYCCVGQVEGRLRSVVGALTRDGRLGPARPSERSGVGHRGCARAWAMDGEQCTGVGHGR